MTDDSYSRMIDDINEAFANSPGKYSKRIDKNLLVRIVLRLKSLSGGCEECAALTSKLSEYIKKHKQGGFQQDYAVYKRLINETTLHLNKKHGLVKEGYYIGAFMSLGISIGAGLGVAFGISVLGNIALGIPLGCCFGLCAGLVLGSAKDAEAKKKGLII